MTDYEDSSLLPPAHLEGTEWHTITPSGFPDAVVFANDVSAIDGTYEMQRYIPEQRYQQLAEVARDLYKAVAPMHEPCWEDTCCNLADNGWACDSCLHVFRDQLEELGVEV